MYIQDQGAQYRNLLKREQIKWNRAEIFLTSRTIQKDTKNSSEVFEVSILFSKAYRPGRTEALYENQGHFSGLIKDIETSYESVSVHLCGKALWGYGPGSFQFWHDACWLYTAVIHIRLVLQLRRIQECYDKIPKKSLWDEADLGCQLDQSMDLLLGDK